MSRPPLALPAGSVDFAALCAADADPRLTNDEVVKAALVVAEVAPPAPVELAGELPQTNENEEA